jgi:pimeloyl-ACP methyl ester carboxylesterase
MEYPPAEPLSLSLPSRPVRRRRWLRRTLLAIVVFIGCAGGVFYWRPLWVIDEATMVWLRWAGVKSEYVQLGPHRIHYLIGGQGKPLVLVHGLGGKAQNFALWIPALVRRGYRVYALDLLGYGDSDRPDVDYSMALEADILNQFFDSQHIARADLGGWSMGGWVALKFAVAHPERVRRVFVDDSAGVFFKPAFDPKLFHPTTTEQVQQLLAWLTPQAARIPKFVARDIIRELHPTQWVVDRAMKSMQSGADLLDNKLSSIQAPVLIVWGKQDILIPLSCGEAMHQKMPGSSLAVFDGCGHLAPVECADRILPETLQFLQAEPAPTPFRRDFPR